jgi:predicted nucleotidyltransferase
MAKIPDKPQDVFVDLTEDYRQVFGKDLVSLILYGSAASGHYVKGKSDINLLVVITKEGINRLEDSLAIVKQWKKNRVAVPLVMTKAFIESSLDCYPIEFLNMKNSHILIHGEDVLEQLKFKPEDLRLQIEKELKGKLVLLRQSYLESEGNSRQIKQLISRSVTAFISIFNALIYLKQGSAQQKRRETIKELAKLFTFDANLFLTCVDIKEGVDKLSGEEIARVFNKYLREVENICNIVDGL